MDSMFLHGSEEVKRAGHNMQDAAASMQRTADRLDHTLSTFLENLERVLAEDRELRSSPQIFIEPGQLVPD